MQMITTENFQQSLPQVMRVAKQHPVEIQAEDGAIFVFQLKTNIAIKDNTNRVTDSQDYQNTSPFNIAGIQTHNQLELDDVFNAIVESRETRY